jgi:threonine dehydratase
VTTFADVQAAAERIAGHVHRTPIFTNRTLDHELGAHVFCKAENLQKVGAFKARGACNAVMAMDAASARRGVLTHSSGNHGAALAWAAAARGVACVVVMPETAPKVKIAAVRGYGAEVVLCRAADRDVVSARLVQERGMTMVHPFEDPSSSCRWAAAGCARAPRWPCARCGPKRGCWGPSPRSSTTPRVRSRPACASRACPTRRPGPTA